MAPGPKLPSDSPMGKDIKSIARVMLKEELSLMVYNDSDDTITLQLMLGKEKVGKAWNLDINWKVDHGHGGGSYPTGLEARSRKS